MAHQNQPLAEEVATSAAVSYTKAMQKAPAGTQLLDPQEILTRIGLAPKMIVGDLGSGSGYFSFQAANMVGNDGAVYSLDVQKNALSALKSKAEFMNIKNIHLVWSNLEVIGAAKRIKNESLDIAFLINVLHQSKNHQNIFAEAYRMVRKGGQLLVIDWMKTGLSFAPAPQDMIPKETAVRLAEGAGFAKTDDFDASRFHYALLFQK